MGSYTLYVGEPHDYGNVLRYSNHDGSVWVNGDVGYALMWFCQAKSTSFSNPYNGNSQTYPAPYNTYNSAGRPEMRYGSAKYDSESDYRTTAHSSWAPTFTLASDEYPSAMTWTAVETNYSCCFEDKFDTWTAANMTLYLSDTAGNNTTKLGTKLIDRSSGYFGLTTGINATNLAGKTPCLKMSGRGGHILRNSFKVVMTTSYLATYTITTTAVTGGSLTVSKASGLTRGASVTITPKPSTGYKLTGLTASAGTLTNNGSTYTLVMPSPCVNVTLTPTWAKIDYTITKTVSPAAAGSFTVKKNGAEVTKANYGDTIYVAQTPASSEYRFQNWSGVTVTNGVFTMPAANTTITANYLKHALTFSNSFLSAEQNDYQLTVAKTGAAVDNFGQSITYLLYKNGVECATFTGDTAVATLTDDEVEKDVRLQVRARSPLVDNSGYLYAWGGEIIFSSKPVHRTVMYFDGTKFVECVPYYYNGAGYVEAEPYYYNGQGWIQTSHS